MEEIKIRDTCNVLNGYAFKSDKYVNEGIRVIRITNVQKGYIEDYKPQYYPLSEYENLKDYTLFENDILISLTGNVGRIAMVTSDFLPALLNQRVACLRVKNNNVDYRYLYYYLLSSRFEKDCVSSAKGVAQKNLSTEWLKEYQINIYPKDKQKEIIKVLDKLTRMISSRKQQLQQLDELVKSRFVEMFGDPTDIRLDRVHLVEYVENTKYGTSQPPQFDENGCFKFIRATNIKNGHIIEKNMLFISKAESEKISKCKLNGGEIIIVRSGANTGDTCIITDEYIGQYAGYDIIVTLKTDKLNPVFLNELINIPQYMKKVVKPLTARSAQPHLNTQQVQSLPILVVDIDKQNEFANFVKQIDKSKVVVQKALDEAQTLFDSLMQEYFG